MAVTQERTGVTLSNMTVDSGDAMICSATLRNGVIAVVCLGLGAASLSATAGALTYDAVTDLTAAGATALSPQVAVSDDGATATAVWLQTVAGEDLVQTRSATIVAGAAQWGSVVTLSNAGADAQDPQVAVSADGTRATAVWSRYNGTTWAVQSRSAVVSGDTSRWGVTSQLSANSLVNDVAENPQVDLSDDGEIAEAVWQRGATGAQKIESAKGVISDTVAMWQADQDVTDDGRDATSPQVALSADGVRGTTVWARATAAAGSPDQIQSRSGGAAGAGWVWGGTLSLSDNSENAKAPALALADDGTAATVVWLWDSAGSDVVQTNSLLIQGAISFSSQTRTLSAAGGSAASPEVAVSETGGGAAAVWSRATVAGRAIESAHATVAAGAATWGAATEITTQGSVFKPHIALSSDGTTTSAIWLAMDGGNRVQAATGQVTGVAAQWGVPQTLSAATADAGDPQFGVSADGLRATAVWENSVGGSVIQSSSAAQTQTITFPAPADTRVDRGPVALSATASSGLPVTYVSQTPGICAIQGSTATLGAPGTCTIVAGQAGNSTYLTAPPAQQAFEVTAAPRQTALSVRARKAGKKLMLRKKAVLVRSVTTDGVVTKRSATCLRKGKETRKACTIKRPGNRIAITPKCSTKVKARVRITAQAQGAQAATFTRTWRVAPKPRKAC